MSYLRFLAMIAASTLAMFGLMYLNTYAITHVFFSETRAWMALYMGAAMAIIMLAFMWRMYEGSARKTSVVLGALLLFALGLLFVRSQRSVDDVAYMKAMIPHHSIAVMTSERARIRDPRVRQLADQILDTQLREIAEMKALIADLERGADDGTGLTAAP